MRKAKSKIKAYPKQRSCPDCGGRLKLDLRFVETCDLKGLLCNSYDYYYYWIIKRRKK
jgi:hypothetical protein